MKTIKRWRAPKEDIRTPNSNLCNLMKIIYYKNLFPLKAKNPLSQPIAAVRTIKITIIFQQDT